MSFIADIATRWASNHPTPYFVGAAPEGTLPPYVTFVTRETRQERSAPNTLNWRTSVVGFAVVADTSVESSDTADFAEQLYNMTSFSSVADMTVIYRATYYTDNPTLTANRAWVTTIDFQAKH